MKKIITLLVFILIVKTTFSQGIFDNNTFDSNIRSVQMQDIIPLGATATLQFDYLNGDAPYMMAKIIHCDWNWEKSVLNDNEFIDGFNELQLSDVEGSATGYIPYYHYRFQVPRVKLSGNYIIHVYDEDNNELNYLTRRFSVYESAVIIAGKRNLSNVVRNRYSHQQIDFAIQYGQYEIQDATETVHAVLRQNYRWDNCIMNLNPTITNVAAKLIKYNFYNGESSFEALAEYRVFDFPIRNFNVDNFEKNNTGTKIFLRQDVNKTDFNYSDTDDINGRFVPNSTTMADYSYVYFTLKTAPIDDNIYIFGQLSDWSFDERFKMTYDDNSKSYKAIVLLKEGEYNYNYAIDRNGKLDESSLQGNHSETENDYEILIYHRPFGLYYDKLISYKRLD